MRISEVREGSLKCSTLTLRSVESDAGVCSLSTISAFRATLTGFFKLMVV